jgi:hypothetical protein
MAEYEYEKASNKHIFSPESGSVRRDVSKIQANFLAAFPVAVPLAETL